MGWKGQYVIVTTLAAAIALHLLSNASLSSSGDGTWAGIFGISAPTGDTAAMAGLVSQRSVLLSEIGQLRHVVSQLEQMDLATDIGEGAALPTTPGVGVRAASFQAAPPPSPPSQLLSAALTLRQQQQQQQQQQPSSPPPPPPSRNSGSSIAQSVSSMVANSVENLRVAVAPRPPVTSSSSSSPLAAAGTALPSGEGTTAGTQLSSGPDVGGGGGAGGSSGGSSEPAVLFEGDGPLPPGLRDFPCALRNFKKAQVTTTCEIDCGDTTCSKARETCAVYVECHAMVLRGGGGRSGGGSSLANAVAVLKTDTSRSRDNSMQRLRQSPWWGTPALATTAKPRIYIVASYGGCGSKMMAGWLSQLSPAHKTYVFHLHDRSPPKELHHMAKPPAPVIKGKGASDYRSGRFPGASRFKVDTGVVPPAKLDDYRVVFIYKDPVEALVSRYGFGHCTHIQGDCGEDQGMSEKTWPKLDVYAKEQRDRMKLMEHFANYMEKGGQAGGSEGAGGSSSSSSSSQPKRSYPIVALNYHKLWDNLPAVTAALGLPPELEKNFPKRTETVRNDATGKAEGNQAHTEATRELLRKLYRPMINSVVENPAVLIV